MFTNILSAFSTFYLAGNGQYLVRVSKVEGDIFQVTLKIYGNVKFSDIGCHESAKKGSVACFILRRGKMLSNESFRPEENFSQPALAKAKSARYPRLGSMAESEFSFFMEAREIFE